jgi:hypothetical protein
MPPRYFHDLVNQTVHRLVRRDLHEKKDGWWFIWVEQTMTLANNAEVGAARQWKYPTSHEMTSNERTEQDAIDWERQLGIGLGESISAEEYERLHHEYRERARSNPRE